MEGCDIPVAARIHGTGDTIAGPALGRGTQRRLRGEGARRPVPADRLRRDGSPPARRRARPPGQRGPSRVGAGRDGCRARAGSRRRWRASRRACDSRRGRAVGGQVAITQPPPWCQPGSRTALSPSGVYTRTGCRPPARAVRPRHFLTKDTMAWFIGHYVSSGVDAADPGVSPLNAGDDVLARVAPAHVVTAEFDPLRDEGEAYAARLERLGVPVTSQRYDGMIHGVLPDGGRHAGRDHGQRARRRGPEEGLRRRLIRGPGAGQMRPCSRSSRSAAFTA